MLWWIVPIYCAAFVLASHAIDIMGGHIVRLVLTWRQARANRGALILTYDDGPGETLQPRLLRLLTQHDVRAMFFLIGDTAAALPGAVEALRADGHQIANHGGAHLNTWRHLPWTNIADILRGERVIASDGERLPWRPPLGRLTLSTAIFCMLTRRPIIMWTLDGCDSLLESPGRHTLDPIVKTLTARDAQNRPVGGCVLLHSFDRSESPDGATRHDYVLHATETLVVAAREAGLRITTHDGDATADRVAAPAQPRASAIQSAA